MKIIITSCILILLCSLSNIYGQANLNFSSSPAEETFKVVEQMPRFPGCEDLEDLETKNKCAQKLMLEYIYKNLKYPKEAQEKEIEGIVVVQFVIGRDGSILEVQQTRELGSGCTEAAIDVVQSMNNMPEKWIPGKQRGRPVRVLYTLPIKFKL